MNNKIYQKVEQSIAFINETSNEEYRLDYAISITGYDVYIWPKTGNHTVWHDIALFCYSFDEYAYPTTKEVNGEERLVFKASIWHLNNE